MISILSAVNTDLDFKGVDVSGDACKKVSADADLPTLVKLESSAKIILGGGKD
jgi:hypothetical protein